MIYALVALILGLIGGGVWLLKHGEAKGRESANLDFLSQGNEASNKVDVSNAETRRKVEEDRQKVKDNQLGYFDE